MPHIKEAKNIWSSLPTYEWGQFNQLESEVTKYLNDKDLREKTIKECQAITAKDHTYVNRIKTIIEVTL